MFGVIRQKVVLPLGYIEDTNNGAVVNSRYYVVGATNSGEDFDVLFGGSWQGCRVVNMNADHYDMQLVPYIIARVDGAGTIDQ